MMRWSVAWAALALSGCLAVPATNPYDPQTPSAQRAKAILTGTAHYPDRSDVEGITVVLLSEDGLTALRSVTLGGATGETFSFEQESGSYRVRAQARFYGSVTAGPLTVAPGETVDLGRLTLQPAPPNAALKGQVQVNGGLAPDGILVTLRSADRDGSCGVVVAQQPTGAGGQFLFGLLGTGRYVVVAQAEGATVDALEVEVPPDATSELPRALTLQPSSAAVQVEAAGTKPAVATRVPNITVHVLPMADMDEMRISEDPTFGSHGTPASWVSYNPQAGFDLGTTEGLRTIHVQLRRGCLTSPVFAADVLYDRTPPQLLSVTLNAGRTFLTDDTAVVPLSLEANDRSGITAVQVLVGEDDPGTTPFTPVEALPGLFRFTTQVNLPAADGTTRVRVRVRDAAGNETPLSEADAFATTITRDTAAPSPADGLTLRVASGRTLLPAAPASGLDARLNDSRPVFHFNPSPEDDVTRPLTYRVELSAGTDFSALLPLGNATPVDVGGARELAVPFALVDGTYRWRVVAVDAAGLSAVSATHVFEVDTVGPAAPPYLTVPSPTALPVDITIPAGADAVRVDVRVQPIPNGTTPLLGEVTGVGAHREVLDTHGSAFLAVQVTGPSVPSGTVPEGQITVMETAPGSGVFQPYATFLVTVFALDDLGNAGVPRTEVFTLDLTAPAPVLLDGAPPPYTNQEQITVRLSFATEVPHLTDPSFLRYEICTARVATPDAPACQDDDDWAPAAGIDGFVVALDANVGGPEANPNTLNVVCARTRDSADNVSEPNCRVTVLDQVPPLPPRLAVPELEVNGEQAVAWLVSQPCPALGAPAVACDANPLAVEIRGGVGQTDFTALPLPEQAASSFSVALPAPDRDADTATAQIRLVDKAGNRSPTSEVIVHRQGDRLLFTLPPDFTLGASFAGSLSPRLAATNGTAFFVPVSTQPLVRGFDTVAYLVAQPADVPDVGLDQASSPMPSAIRPFGNGGYDDPEDEPEDVNLSYLFRIGGGGAAHGALSWVHTYTDVATRGFFEITGGTGRVTLTWPDEHGRFDVRGTNREGELILNDGRCRYGFYSQCQETVLGWPGLYGLFDFTDSTTDGRSVLLTTPGNSRVVVDGAPAGELTITGPHVLGLRVTALPEVPTPYPRALQLDIQLPAGATFYGAAYDISFGAYAVASYGLDQYTARGGGKEWVELFGRQYISDNEDAVLALILPEGVTATVPLVSLPGPVGPLVPTGTLSRPLATLDDAENLPVTDPTGQDSDTVVPVAEVMLLNENTQSAAAILLDWGADRRPAPNPQTAERVAEAGVPLDDVKERLLEEDSPFRWAATGTVGTPVVPPGACVLAVTATEDKILRRVRVRGRGALDDLKFFLWEKDSSRSLGAYYQQYLSSQFHGGLELQAEGGVDRCDDRPGGCASAASYETRFLLAAGKQYLLMVGTELVQNNRLTGYGWPASNPEAALNAAPQPLGFMEVEGTVTRTALAVEVDALGLQALTVDPSAPTCVMELEAMDRISYGRPAVEAGSVVFTRRAEQPSGPPVVSVLAGAPGPSGRVTRPDLRVVDTLPAGGRTLATQVHDGVVRWVALLPDGSGQLRQVETSPWPPGPPVTVLDLEGGDPLRPTLASLAGDRLVVTGESASGLETRVYQLTRDSRGAVELRRFPARPSTTALALDGDDLFAWVEGVQGGQLYHRDLGDLVSLHAGGLDRVVNFGMRPPPPGGAVGSALAVLAPISGPLETEVLELDGSAGGSRVLASGSLRLHPVAVGSQVAMLRLPAVLETAPVPGSEVKVVLRPLDGSDPSVADVELPAASLALSGVPALSAREWISRVTLAADGQTLAVLGADASGEPELSLFELDGTDPALVVSAITPLPLTDVETLHVSGDLVAVLSADGSATVLLRNDSGQWAPLDWETEATALLGDGRNKRVLGITDGMLVVTEEPQTIPTLTEYLSFAEVALLRLGAQPGVEARMRLPALAYFHRFTTAALAADGDLLLYDTSAVPDALWRLDRTTGNARVLATRHRPFNLLTESVGNAAAPRVSGSAIYFLRQGTTGMGLYRYRSLEP
ncbi:MAG: hypothetical protein AB2A00_11120 [Myxococcota bacterium]